MECTADDNPEMPKGFPRPKFELEGKVYPLPYSARTNIISVLSDPRHEECLLNWLCLVCGDPVEDEVITCLMKKDSNVTPRPKFKDFNAESAPFHDKCARLTISMCPAVKYDSDYYLAKHPKEFVLEAMTKWRNK